MAAAQQNHNSRNNNSVTGKTLNIAKIGSIERTNTGLLDEFRKSQLRN